MAIAEMERVYLLLPEDKKRVAVESIQNLGLVEVTELTEEELPSENSDQIASPEEKKRDLSEKEKEVDENLFRINYLLNFLKKRGAVPLPKLPINAPFQEKATFPLTSCFGEAKSLEKRDEEIKQLTERLGRIYQNLEPLTSIDLPLRELGLKGKTVASLYQVPASRVQEVLKVFHQTPVFATSLLRKKGKAILFLVYLREEAEKVSEILINNFRAQEISLPGYRTTPYQTCLRIRRIIEKNEQRAVNLEKRKDKFYRYLPEILGLYDIYQIKKAQISACKKIYNTKSVAVFAGWIRKRDRRYLGERLKSLFPEMEIVTRPPQKGESVPVALENNQAGKPFEAVVDLYGRTHYQGTDPSLYLSFFFTISFAFCLADVGYGLILFLLSLILRKRFLEENAQKMLKVFAIGGISASLVGVITNSWFGNLFANFSVLQKLAEFQRRISLISPVDRPSDTMRLFYFSILFGYLQVTTGVMLKLKEAVRRFGGRGVLESAPSLVFQIGIPLLIGLFLLRSRLPVAGAILSLKIILAATAVVIIYNQWHTQRDLTLRLFWSGYAIYGLLAGNLLGDLVSYARIFALGLTSGLLAVTVNQLAVMAKSMPLIGPVLLVLILLAGHAFNLFISTLGSYVHTSRLQYLEFFSKFYDSGGKPFNPLRKQFRYLKPD